MKRVLQPRHVKVNADPTGTNLIVRRPFSYKLESPLTYDTTTLASSYAKVFPEYNIGVIRGARIDRVAAWGSDGDGAPPLYLAVGDFFSRRDVGGRNQRPRVCYIPKLEQGQSDESTVIVFSGAELIHISGVVYLDRENIPTTTGRTLVNNAPPIDSVTSLSSTVSTCSALARPICSHGMALASEPLPSEGQVTKDGIVH
jgi:hypothetical protein